MKILIKASIIRALWTAGEAALITIGTNATFWSDVNWIAVLSASALGFVIAFIKCMVTGLPEVDYYKQLQNELEGTEDPDDDGAEEEFDDD